MSSQQARTYHSPLRDRRVAETRELVLTATAEIVVERGATEFSMREVAERADVALRTVYRYFPSRQELLDGLAIMVEERLGDWLEHSDPDWTDPANRSVQALLASVPAVFDRFDRLEPLSTAMAMLSAAGMRTSGTHDQRTEVFKAIVADRLDGGSSEAAHDFAVIRHLISSNTWLALRQGFGLSGREAGEAVARVVAQLLGADAQAIAKE